MTIKAYRAIRLAAALLLIASATPASAQQLDGAAYRNVISANPFGLLLEWFNAEYERAVSDDVTAGFGGSTFSNDGDRYINADVFFRYYPGGRPFDGWAFGAKAGVTKVANTGTFPGFGFDANRSWLLGARDNFYVGIGFGLKRLIGVSDDEDFDLRFIPTIRLVNIGFAF